MKVMYNVRVRSELVSSDTIEVDPKGNLGSICVTLIDKLREQYGTLAEIRLTIPSSKKE